MDRCKKRQWDEVALDTMPCSIEHTPSEEHPAPSRDRTGKLRIWHAHEKHIIQASSLLRETATQKERAMTITNPSVSTLAPAVGYSHVTATTGTRLVFCAGQGALDAQGNLVGIHDLASQTTQAIKNLALALEAANATLADVVKTTVYVVGLDDDSLSLIFAGISAASEETGQPFPVVAGTLLGVQRLAVADALIEIEAIAILP
jgi:enamine deaminase RidA (YjgF/YER057c/UK114 family)